LNLVGGRINEVLAGANGRVLGKRDLLRLFEALGNQMARCLGDVELARTVADDLEVDRLASLHLRAGGAQLGHRGCLLCAGLRHVGTRALAHFKARVGSTNLLAKELEVALAENRYLPVAQHVDIGCGGVEEDVLFAVAQALVRGAHAGFRRIDGVKGLKAVEDRLLDLDAEGARADLDTLIVRIGQAAACSDRRAPAGLCDRDAFIRDTDAGACGIERRIVGIRLGQGTLQRLTEGWSRCQRYTRNKRGKQTFADRKQVPPLNMPSGGYASRLTRTNPRAS